MLKKLSLLIVMLLIPLQLMAQTPEQKAEALLEDIRKKGEGFVDVISTTKMIVKDRGEVVSERTLDIKTLETPEGPRTMMVFKAPKREKGISLLTISNEDGESDQWLYIPSLKRVKKMASNNKSGPFMGSEFSYEDLGLAAEDDYDYKYLREEKLDGVDCHVIESMPVDKYSGYSRVVTWVDKKELYSRKVDFYDRKGKLLKTLTPADFQLFEEKFWRPTKLKMVNHQTDKETQFVMQKISFKNGLRKEEFNEIALRRMRI